MKLVESHTGFDNFKAHICLLYALFQFKVDAFQIHARTLGNAPSSLTISNVHAILASMERHATVRLKMLFSFCRKAVF